MSAQDDETQTYALMGAGGVIALVIAGVLTLAIWATHRSHGAAPRPAAQAATEKGANPYAGQGTVQAAQAAQAAQGSRRIYFASGSEALPEGASQQLVEVADAVRGQPGRAVLISGFHDASGDPARNADLAKRRALAVRHALEANGLVADQLVMDKPVLAEGGTDPREARRVEVRIR